MRVTSTHTENKVHVVDESVDMADWRGDLTHCDREVHVTKEVTMENAASVADQMCEVCRQQADMMSVYELADEADVVA